MLNLQNSTDSAIRNGLERRWKRRPALTTTKDHFGMADLPVPIITDAVKARFWSKVIQKDCSECWPVLTHKNAAGYGYMSVGGRNGGRYGMHVMALYIAGRPKTGPYSLHLCDNPGCANPNHLDWGTAKENMRQCSVRNRRIPAHPNGEKAGMSKLENEQVLAIRASSEDWNTLAKRYNVSKYTIWDIRKRRTWWHI